MSVVSVAETSESSLFAKVDIYWYPEWNGRHSIAVHIWYGFWKQEVCNTRGNKMTSG